MAKRLLLISSILLLLLSSSIASDFNLDEEKESTLASTQGLTKTFILNKEEYEIIFDRIGDTRIMLTINPGKNIVVLDIAQEKEVDLNNDKTSDISIKLDSIIDLSANLIIKSLAEEEEEEKPIIPILEENITEEPPTDKITGTISGIQNIIKGNLKIVYFVVLVIIIIIVGAFIHKKGESSERLFKKAENLHREGEEFHRDGDDETANELYEKAEEFREKARQLEFR